MGRPPRTWKCRWWTLWPASGPMFVTIRCPPRGSPRRATSRHDAEHLGQQVAVLRRRDREPRRCARLGITRTWVGAAGLMSLNASDVVRLVHDLGAELLRHDLAEQAVRHLYLRSFELTRHPMKRLRPRAGPGSRRPLSPPLARRRSLRASPSLEPDPHVVVGLSRANARRRPRRARPRPGPRAAPPDGRRGTRARISLPRVDQSLRSILLDLRWNGVGHLGGRGVRAAPSNGRRAASRTGARARRPSSSRTRRPISPGKPTMMSVARARPGSASFARLDRIDVLLDVVRPIHRGEHSCDRRTAAARGGSGTSAARLP